MLSPEFRGGVHYETAIRAIGPVPSIYRVTQLRANGAHCREPAGTGPVNLKVVPNECCLGRSPWTHSYVPLSFPHPLLVWSGHVESTGCKNGPECEKQQFFSKIFRFKAIRAIGPVPSIYRVTQLRTNGAHCRESAGTGPLNLKVVPNECCLGRSPWTNSYVPLFPTPTIGMEWAC